MLAGSIARPARAYADGATTDPAARPPYPIPWLDKNLHHNQVPRHGGPPTELSHIYNFRGKVARALFDGQGTTGDGSTLYIGKGTDYGVSIGSYIAADGNVYQAAFGHI